MSAGRRPFFVDIRLSAGRLRGTRPARGGVTAAGGAGSQGRGAARFSLAGPVRRVHCGCRVASGAALRPGGRGTAGGKPYWTFSSLLRFQHPA
jgi:hypothetical protein